MAAPKTQAIESGLDSILRNSSLLMGAKIVSSAVGMVVMVLLPRLLGDAEFGRLHLAISLTALLVLASVVRLAIQALAIRRLEGFRIPTRAETLPWRRLLVAGLPFLAWQGLGLFYFRLDVIMLGRMTSDATVGWYGAGSRLLESFTFIPDLLMAAMLPVVARLWTTSPTQFQAASQKTLDLLLVATIPLVVVLLTLAGPIVDLLFGAGQFGPSIPILRIKALTLPVLFVDYYLATILIAVGRERRWLLIAVVACFVSPALNWVLIPLTDARYANGGIGAAVATLVTEVLIMTSAIRFTPRDAFGPASWQVGLQATGAGLATGSVILLGLALGAPWIPAAIAG